MPGCGFSLTRIFPFSLTRTYTGKYESEKIRILAYFTLSKHTSFCHELNYSNELRQLDGIAIRDNFKM